MWKVLHKDSDPFEKKAQGNLEIVYFKKQKFDKKYMRSIPLLIGTCQLIAETRLLSDRYHSSVV